MQSLARGLMLAGVVLLLVGLGLRAFGGRLGWLGHLPGDMRLGNTVYVPLTSCIVVSVFLSLVLNVLARIFRR